MRFWKRHEEPAARKGLRQATLQGASREELIEESLAELVEGKPADRIGVWLEASGPRGSAVDAPFYGLVWDRENEDTPREWRVLEPRSVLPAARLVAGSEIEIHLSHSPMAPMVGPVAGLQKVVWIPVEHAGKLRGILMAGATAAQKALPKEKLKLVATELAIALAFESEQRQKDQDYD